MISTCTNHCAFHASLPTLPPARPINKFQHNKGRLHACRFTPHSTMTSNATAVYLDHLTLRSTPKMPKRANAGSSARPKFQCMLCASTFSRKDNLKTHQRLHSGEMPFQCKYCGRKFRWQSSARTHEQVHERHGHQPRPELAAAAEAAKSSPAPRVKVESVVHAYSAPSPTTTYSTLPQSHSYSNPLPPPQPQPQPQPQRTFNAPVSTTNPSLTYNTSSSALSPPVYAPTAYAPPVVSNPLLYSSAQSTTPLSTPSNLLPLPHQSPPPPPPPLYSTTVTTAYATPPMLPLHPPPLYTAASRPLHPLPTRALPPRHVIRKPRSGSTASAAAGLLSLDFEEVMGEVGAALHTSIAQDSAQTPQQAHGESPMFNLPNMSQQDIEKCLEPPHHAQQPPTSQ